MVTVVAPRPGFTTASRLSNCLAHGISTDRRISNRLLNVWSQAARGQFPSWDDIRSHDLGTDGNWIFVVDCAESDSFAYFTYLGAKLARLSEVYLSGDEANGEPQASGEWEISLLDKATSYVNAAIEARAPCLDADTLRLWDGRELLFRCMTAPLSDDGREITHVMGVVSGRIPTAAHG